MADKWDATLYDGKHSFVYQFGQDILELLAPKEGERILDLGCGTGHLTHKIAVAGADVIGIDNSQAMIDQARKNYPDLRFENSDARDFHFSPPFDGVFSNATLHWIKESGQVVELIHRSLKPDGRFVAEFGGKENIKLIVAAITQAMEVHGYHRGHLADTWYFPSIGEYGTLLEEQGFNLTHAWSFDRLTALEDGEEGMRNWIEMFAKVLFQGVPADKNPDIIKDAENWLRPKLFRDGIWFADYRRIRVVALKMDNRLLLETIK